MPKSNPMGEPKDDDGTERTQTDPQVEEQPDGPTRPPKKDKQQDGTTEEC